MGKEVQGIKDGKGRMMGKRVARSMCVTKKMEMDLRRGQRVATGHTVVVQIWAIRLRRKDMNDYGERGVGQLPLT